MRRHRIVGFHEWANVRTFESVLVNSAFSRESLLRAYGYDSRVCYLGVDTELFQPLERPRGRALVGIGEVRPHKNIELVIEAVGILAVPRPPLVWVGNEYDGDYRAKLIDLARRRGVSLSFQIQLGDSELRDLLNVSAAMVYAPRLEPFGLAPLEAAACGLPVVGTAEGGVRESVLDGVTGFLVDHQAQDMAAAITRILDDPLLAAKLGYEARKHAKNVFSLEAAAERLERYLEEAAGN
jgi:glycosyltransferase involved in cell wall biosynthesis